MPWMEERTSIDQISVVYGKKSLSLWNPIRWDSVILSSTSDRFAGASAILLNLTPITCRSLRTVELVFAAISPIPVTPAISNKPIEISRCSGIRVIQSAYRG